MKYSSGIDINKLEIKSIRTIDGKRLGCGEYFGRTNIIRKILPNCDVTGKVYRYILLSDDDELIGSVESTAVTFVEYMEDK